MMKIQFSLELVRNLKKIKSKDKPLTEKIVKQLSLFQQDPRHPSLRTHKLAGGLRESWSISITRSIRMKFILFENGTAYFFDLGTHEEVYRR